MFVVLNNLKFKVSAFSHHLLLHPSDKPTLHLPYLAKQILDNSNTTIIDVRATEEEICISYDSESPEQILDYLSTLPIETVSETRKHFVLPVLFYETEDMSHIETHTGMSSDDYIKHLISAKYTLRMLGFVPGFLYMTGLENKLHVPRKSMPVTNIPAGSIAVGGEFLGLYSLSTPAGWNVIGKTPIRVLDIPNTPPMVVSPGDTIEIKSISEDEFRVLEVMAQNIIEYND